MLCTDCLALRDQVAIYENELDMLHEEHQTQQLTDIQQLKGVKNPRRSGTGQLGSLRADRHVFISDSGAKGTIESLVEPSDGVATVTVEFPTPDVTPTILGIKEYYCQLEESLQFEFKATSAVSLGDHKVAELAKGPKVAVTDASKVTDVGELKNLIAELQRELADLEKCGEELEVEIEERKEVYLEEIAELQVRRPCGDSQSPPAIGWTCVCSCVTLCCVEELENAQADLDTQMKEQCADYDELLSEKMALDIEIAAYRDLVELEEDRLCYL
ncbi:hypothetical protein SKAU_G00226780 [Synaphobranchus kaupii]|uniref:IF rod domain-containing protein n=1 Tax=Synaphobranchus kaupii TaxID=118154 RepID=A0A9Q1F4U0_SYNKA|nr:hypothetical protein SKAU_G00226780 [Synaphobranchus kaupii]